GEARVGAAAPLHGRAHALAAGQGEVVAHADLVAVADDGHARQAEQQAVAEADEALIAVEHRVETAADAAAPDAHLLLRPEGLEHLLALRVAELAERQLVVVAQEVQPLLVAADARQLAERLAEGRGAAA